MTVNPITIITDSTCDIPALWRTQFNIITVPLTIVWGDQQYLDGVDMAHEQFYEGLPHFDHHPTTSVPGPGQLVQEYERLAAAGATAIISIHIGSALSAMVGVARLAAQETQKVPVSVFDSGQLTLGSGLLALTAARAAAEGQVLDDILATLEDPAVGIADTLDQGRPGGGNLPFGRSTDSPC